MGGTVAPSRSCLYCRCLACKCRTRADNRLEMTRMVKSSPEVLTQQTWLGVCAVTSAN